MYVALVLDQESQNLLKNQFKEQIPQDWSVICHHMTINMGDEKKSPAAHMIGQDATLQAVSFAKDDRVCAIGVITNVPSTNERKHVTIAVNTKDGGKPFFSNQLETWVPLDAPISLKGKITIVG